MERFNFFGKKKFLWMYVLVGVWMSVLIDVWMGVFAFTHLKI